MAPLAKKVLDPWYSWWYQTTLDKKQGKTQSRLFAYCRAT